jgi:3-(3-hydroxy-phenyl)propionate hydroxylase
MGDEAERIFGRKNFMELYAVFTTPQLYTVKSKDGKTETLTASFLVGADGIGSVVRSAVGAAFDGITIPELFLTLSTTYDFREAMPDIANISYLSDPKEWYVLITRKVWRALFPVDAARQQGSHIGRTRSVCCRAPCRAASVSGDRTAAYRVHERVLRPMNGVSRAAMPRVNNPLGSIGLNGGIHDAFNLAEKLTQVIRGAPLELMGVTAGSAAGGRCRQQTTLRNRAILNTREPAALRPYYDGSPHCRRPEKHREYVMRTSMIQSLRDVAKLD